MKPKFTLNKKLSHLTRHRLAVIGGVALILLYAMCLLAEFIAPYHYDNESRAHSYSPPSKIHWIGTDKKFHIVPFVYGTSYGFDEYYRRIFVEDTSKHYPIGLLVKGDTYRLFGIIPINRHLFGTTADCRFYLVGADNRGRDLFSRIVYGSRVSLTIGLVGVFFSTLIGLAVGGIAGYFGGKIDEVLMRICEMIMLVPSFYLLLALRAAFPPNLSSVSVYLLIVLILSFIGWAGLGRVIRGMTMSLRQREFVVAAQAAGASHGTIIFRHLLPQTFSFLIVSITLSIPAYILGESGLSLIGLGIGDPYASWGNLLSDAMNIADIKFHPWILLPGVFIFVTVMAFNFVGDGLRDVFDPQSDK